MKHCFISIKYLYFKQNILKKLGNFCEKKGYQKGRIYFLQKYVKNSQKITDKLESMSKKDKVSRGFGNL